MDYVLNEHLEFKPTWSICKTISDNIVIQLIWRFQESNWNPDWFIALMYSVGTNFFFTNNKNLGQYDQNAIPSQIMPCYREREREIKFIGLFENRGHRGPYSPYKPFNHNLYIGIIIFPHIDNPQYTGYDLPKKKTNKIINAKKVRAPLIWQIIGEKDSGSVYMWI